MQRLASILRVKPEEGRLVLLVGILFLCIQAGQGMGDNAASALFFLRFGVDFLPYMYLMLGVTTFVLTMAYSAGLGRFDRSRFFQALLLGTMLLLLVERLALVRPFSLLYPILWLTISCIGMILGTFVWNLAGEVSDARQAKRLFPLYTSAGILGSVVGNSVTGVVAKWLGTDNLLIFFAALLGFSYFLTRSIASGYFQPAKQASKSSSFWNDLRAGYDFVRGSTLMKLIAYASVLVLDPVLCDRLPVQQGGDRLVSRRSQRGRLPGSVQRHHDRGHVPGLAVARQPRLCAARHRQQRAADAADLSLRLRGICEPIHI